MDETSTSDDSSRGFGCTELESTLRALVPAGLLFVSKDIDGLDAEGWKRLLRDLYGPGDLDLRLANLHLVLPLLHQARTKDEKRFFLDLFLPWIGLRRRLDVNRNRILDEFARTESRTPGTAEDFAHLVNIYRNVVADLLDPYLTLLVACYQFLEGNFSNIVIANFGQGERNKDEYLNSRIKDQDRAVRLLSGYDPVVRNAVSHSGTHGVTYQPHKVLFRSINRGRTPTVQSVEWTEQELLRNINRLFECILSIDAAVAVFGLDVSEHIGQDWDLLSQALHFTSSAATRVAMRARTDNAMKSIRSNEQLSAEERFRALSDVFRHNCVLRKLPLMALKSSIAPKLIRIEVPAIKIDGADDRQLVNRTMELSRYAILAEAAYGEMADVYVIAEHHEAGGEQVVAAFEREMLHEYGEERAGLLDLVHNSTIHVNGNVVLLSVDFESVHKNERESLGENFPRRIR